MLQQQIDKLKFKVENFCSSKDVISKVKKKKKPENPKNSKICKPFFDKGLVPVIYKHTRTHNSNIKKTNNLL